MGGYIEEYVGKWRLGGRGDGRWTTGRLQVREILLETYLMEKVKVHL